MANPNIVNVSQIYGKTATSKLYTTDSNLVVNASSSGKIIKINSLYIANKNGTTAGDVTVYHVGGAAGTVELAYTISVPADATLVLISKDAGIYLEEGQSLVAKASADGLLVAICSYEEIS